MQASSGFGEWGLLFVEACGLLTAVTSLLEENGDSRCVGFGGCSTWAQQLWRARSRVSGSAVGAGVWLLLNMWTLPGPGTEPMSPELAGRFLSTVSPGKSHKFVFKNVSPAAM